MPATTKNSESPRRWSSGSVRSQIFALAMPVLTEQLLSFCVALTDTYLSGRLGPSVTNAVGLAAYVGWLASMIVGLIGVGTSAIVARCWGRADFEDARAVLSQSLVLGVGVAAAFSLAIVPTAPLLARLLGLEAESARIAVGYLRLDAIGHVFMGWILVAAAGYRGAGIMRVPLITLGSVNVLNVALSFAFMYGLGTPGSLFSIAPMGADGIVLGTVVAKGLGAILISAVLVRGVGGLFVVPAGLKPDRTTTRRILKIGIPAAADGAVMWGGQFLFLMLIARMGTGDSEGIALAAHIVGIRVEAITYLPAVAWGAAASALVGQSLGAADTDRAIAAGHEAVRQCGLMAIGITLIFFFGADQIYNVMHKSEAVRAEGIPPFRMLALFQVPLVISIVYVQALRGAGDTRFPLAITAAGVFLIRLPLAYLFGWVLGFGLLGAWAGMCVDILVRAILSTARYVGARWVDTDV
ncbi:MATE family efflux transporter [Stratiformator vulcanicus]|uniref:Multidrug-efflux transporter n=1 Tax=Stratiformator vulcanicus TaxID=2527980 RepID=A0A517R332_9PLAN|nr:MATE family efflux transporter [Stratiformator vulcanicus]QDT38263.1 Multidrug resistance protein NorM [Stratiformator vulcanicus]